MKRALAVVFSLLCAVAIAQESGDARLRDDAFAPARTRDRRARLVRSLGEGAVFIAKQRPVADAEELEQWQPSRDLLYLTGLRDPQLVLVLTADEHVLFAPPRDVGAEKWRGARLSPGDGAAQATGLDRVLPLAALKGHLARSFENARSAWLDGITKDELAALATLPEELKLERGAAKVGLLRQVKDEAELALLRRAIDASCAGHVEAMRSAAPGRFEFEIQAAAEYVWRRAGAEREGYASIVGSGPNSCILHYGANRRRIEDGDIVCADMGAEVGGYTADVTRTWPANGRFTDEQRKIYEIVLRAQQAGFDAVKPGATIRQVDAAARKVIKDAGYAEYFPHGTSHWLGLDVHDVGDYARPFEPGMVLTVEPGIYIPDKAIGVRIEDDVLVTRDGRFVLSDSAPRTIDEIEALVRSGSGVGAKPVTPLAPPTPLPPLRRGRLY